MKKILILAIISGILFSCKNDKGKDSNAGKLLGEDDYGNSDSKNFLNQADDDQNWK